MKIQGKIARAVVVLAHAVLGWAYCGALIGVGRQFLPMPAVLVLHAIGAALGFALLSWVYHRHFGFTRPLVTAIVFLAVVMTLDVFLVAMLIERSFDMFRSLIGTWLPFGLIFAVTYGVGRNTINRSQRIGVSA